MTLSAYQLRKESTSRCLLQMLIPVLSFMIKNTTYAKLLVHPLVSHLTFAQSPPIFTFSVFLSFTSLRIILAIKRLKLVSGRSLTLPILKLILIVSLGKLNVESQNNLLLLNYILPKYMRDSVYKSECTIACKNKYKSL